MTIRTVLSFIFPQTILKTSSPYNKIIRVNLELGRYKLLVNGSRQSGAHIETLWKHAFEAFQMHKVEKMNSILVLGVGGGSVIELLHGQFPHAAIIGVDIDEVIIDIGKKYFGLKNIMNLQIVHEDARQFIKDTHRNKFDLVVVDLYSGRVIPDFVISEDFIDTCTKSLKSNGMFVVNYLRELEYGKKSDKLNVLLQKYFTIVKDYPIALNRFFFAQELARN